MKYNFDLLSNRLNTDSVKWDVKENELPMWVADMDFKVFPDIVEALRKRVNIEAYGYTEIPEAYFNNIIWWWSYRHNVTFKREWMTYCSGAVPAISSIVRKITNPGDNVIIQSPVYNCFYSSVENNGRLILDNKLINNNYEYSINFDELEEMMKLERTTLMILCNPHNPVGRIWKEEELYKISCLAKKYGVKVISDEIHCDITSPDVRYNSFIKCAKENTDVSITCLSASKVFNVAGLQAACVIIPDPELRKKIDRGFNDDEIAEPNFFSMDANVAAYTSRGDEWVNQLNEYIYQNKLYFFDYLEKNCPKLHPVKGNATYLVWVDISEYNLKSGLFASMLREKTGLFIATGEKYRGEGVNYIRVNLATSLKNVKDACVRLKSFLDSLGE